MERSTAKTMDAFVEFKTQKDAETAVRRLSFTESGRYARLGTRHVDISMSSQDELLKNIFPRANCIQWQNGSPVLLENNDPYSVGFQGFLTKEEVRGLVTHAENPARVCILTFKALFHTSDTVSSPRLPNVVANVHTNV